MRSDDYRKLYGQVVAPSTMCGHLPVVVRGRGATVWDAEGRAFIDFTSQVGIANLGYCHPLVSEAIAKTAEQLSCMLANDQHYCMPIHVSGERWEISPARLAEMLIAIAPTQGKKCVIFEISGATAVNAAVKLLVLARRERKKFLCFEGSFHGRHGYALDLTRSASVHREWFPRTGLDVAAIPFPTVAKAFDHETVFGALRTVNALVGELIAAEGGGIAPASRSVKDLVGHLQSHGVAFACDEVQTGIGRTGQWFAAQAYDIDPDVLITAKALGGGLPLAAVVFKEELLADLPGKTLPTGWHSGTMPGAPLAVAAAIATLQAISREKLLERCQNMIQGMLAMALHKILVKYGNVVTAIRGIGAMWGIEIGTPELRSDVLRAAVERGLCLIGAGPSNKPAIRIMPPLVISADELLCGLQILDEAIESVSKKTV